MLASTTNFAQVFFLFAVLRNSGASNSSVINATSSYIPQVSHSTYSIDSLSTTTTVPTAPATTSILAPTQATSIGSPGNVSSDGGGNSGTTTQPPTTTPPPTTVPTTPHPCLSAASPKDIEKCANESCAEKVLSQMELFINCEKTGSENYRKHPTTMAEMGEKLALRIAQDIKTKLEMREPVNATVVIVTDHLAMGASTIDSAMYTNISRAMFHFPNTSHEGMSDKLGKRVANGILYPKKDLPMRSGLVQVAWSISEAWQTTVPDEEIEPFRDIVWRLPISDMKIEKNKIKVSKEKPDLTINSPVITFSLVPKPDTPLENPFHIVFRRPKSEGVRNHRCCFWSETSPSSGFWSSVAGNVIQNNDTHTVCSYNLMSTFVVLSEIHQEPDEDAKKAVHIVAIVFSILAMAALIATIQMTRKLQCMDNDRVNIHIHLCVILLIGYFLFIIGAIKSDNEVLNDILATSLHFCQLSPFVWLCLEVVYFMNTLWPIFNYENTNTQTLYVSLGWALTAAFAGATAGYDLPHNGKPHASEIAWVFINKSTCGYFFGPLLALLVINILSRVGLVVCVFIRPQQNDNDKTPLRIKVNLLTTLVLTAVLLLAWCLGVKAVNNTETKGYHYGFLTLYCFQAFLVFIIYGWQNEEMWSMHNKRKEEQRQIEERKITFTYVP